MIHHQKAVLEWISECADLAEGFDAIADRLEHVTDECAHLHIRASVGLTDPLSWCASQVAGRRWYFRSCGGVGAGSEYEVAGIGIACFGDSLRDEAVADLLSLSTRSATCTGPVGFAWSMFDLGTTAVGEWSDFGARRVVIPRIDIRREGGRCSVGLTVCGDVKGALRALAAVRATTTIATAERFALAGDDNPAVWADSMERVLGLIETGVAQKIVLARTRCYEQPTPVDPFSVLVRLRTEEPTAYLSVVEPRAGTAFVMATPERLVRRRGRIIESHAVAGTCGRGPTPEADEQLAARLLRSEKNRREHEITVRHIDDALRPLSTELSWQSQPRVVRLTHVQHLVTEVRGALFEGVDDEAIIEALHPTPAVCGVPASKAMEAIRLCESTPRGLYAGVVGVACGAASDFAVGIRSALIRDSRVMAFAGAGIVEGSDADAEWLETARKLETFDALLRPSSSAQ
ncbi:MAG: isochorismate synthase [Planctomycetota bacterium]|nr:isochorismate synthase [Planctomycetota bacterium]